MVEVLRQWAVVEDSWCCQEVSGALGLLPAVHLIAPDRRGAAHPHRYSHLAAEEAQTQGWLHRPEVVACELRHRSLETQIRRQQLQYFPSSQHCYAATLQSLVVEAGQLAFPSWVADRPCADLPELPYAWQWQHV